MPELAEVERARKELESIASPGRFVSNVISFEDKLVFSGITANQFSEQIKGKKVVSTGRKGKNFYLLFDSPPHAVFHLAMSGSTQILGLEATTYRLPRSNNDAQTWPPKFVKTVITFSETKPGGEDEIVGEWSFSDSRRFARIKLVPDHPEKCEPISLLGADPYLAMPSLPILSAQILKSKAPIKALLLNQNGPLCGIGNWMIDEILYQAQLHPEHPSHLLQEIELARLWKEIQTITNTAVGVNANSSLFPSDWLFNYRWSKGKKEQALVTLADGSQSTVTFITVGGRTSAIIESVQILPPKVKEMMEEKIKLASERKMARMAKIEKGEEEENGEEKEEEENGEESKGKNSKKRKEEEVEDLVSPYFKSPKSKNRLDLSDPALSPSKSTKATKSIKLSPSKVKKETVVKEKKIRKSKKSKLEILEEIEK